LYEAINVQYPLKGDYMKYFAVILTLSSLLLGCAVTTKPIHHEQNGTVSVGVEKSKWLASFQTRGLELKIEKGNQDSGYFVWGQGTSTLTIIIEPVTKCTSAISCRDQSLNIIKKADPYSRGHKSWEKDTFAYSEFVSNRGGVNQLHVNKHSVKDGFWCDMHFSKGNPADQDEKYAIDYLENINLVRKNE
jgi:hypothetical protein